MSAALCGSTRSVPSFCGNTTTIDLAVCFPCTCDVIFTAQPALKMRPLYGRCWSRTSNYIVGVGLCHTQSVRYHHASISSMVYASSVPLILTAAGNKPDPQPPVYPLRHQTRSHHSYQFRHCRYYHAGFGHGRYLSHRGHRASQPKCQKSPSCSNSPPPNVMLPPTSFHLSVPSSISSWTSWHKRHSMRLSCRRP